MGVLSSVGLLGLICALGPGKHKFVNHGPPELWEVCVRGSGLDEAVSASFLTNLFISVRLT